MTTAAAAPATQHMAFTCRADGRAAALTYDVEIFAPFIPPAASSGSLKCKALFDTGASHSSVSPRVVAELQLASIGNTNVGVGGGTLPTTSHVVNIALPNRVMFPMVRVTKVTLHGGIDVLIGMDILGTGDFAVSNFEGKTTFSFCCPSRREIDFVAELNASRRTAAAHLAKRVGRNDPCPCGSGKKFKKCCGR